MTQNNFTISVDVLVYLTRIDLLSSYCQRFKAEYGKAAEELAKEDPPLYIAKVNVDDERKLATRFAITGLPTLYFFNNGKKMDYTGARSTEGIVEWVKQLSYPISNRV